MSTNRETDLISECLKAWYGPECRTENDQEGMARVIALVREHNTPSLRDQFAMKALPWALERNYGNDWGAAGKRHAPAAAEKAYAIADAMLAARGGPSHD